MKSHLIQSYPLEEKKKHVNREKSVAIDLVTAEKTDKWIDTERDPGPLGRAPVPYGSISIWSSDRVE